MDFVKPYEELKHLMKRDALDLVKNGPQPEYSVREKLLPTPDGKRRFWQYTSSPDEKKVFWEYTNLTDVIIRELVDDGKVARVQILDEKGERKDYLITPELERKVARKYHGHFPNGEISIQDMVGG